MSNNEILRIKKDVHDFYKKLPFNINESPKKNAELIRKSNSVPYIYPCIEDFGLHTKVLELGCGTGWLANTIAYYYHVSEVFAVDFNNVAINFAKESSNILGTNVKFICSDLFSYNGEKCDIVISNGVLHHTGDTLGGISKCASMVKPNGKLFLGLYHKYGRKPFLYYFEKIRKNGSSISELFEQYKKMDTRFSDETQLRSWFLDQVCHPYETQHTLQEIVPILEDNGIMLLKTSINKYRPWRTVTELYDMEYGLYDYGRDFIEKGKYWPGFFYVLGVKIL